MPQAERFDVLVLGSGTGGKLTRLAYGAIGSAHCRRRKAVDRRRVPEHRLHAEQE